MPYNFRDYNPEQLLLLAPNLDGLTQDHLARSISAVVDELDLKPLLRRFRDNGQGGAAYKPLIMLKLLFCAYCVGVPSSRKIAQEIINDVAFRWLAPNNRHDFSTIAAFRRRHLKALKPILLQVLLLCKRAGLVKVGIDALDGTKVAANASMTRNRTWKKLSEQEQVLLAEVENLLCEAEGTDRDEDKRFGADAGDGLSKLGSTRQRLAKIRAAKAELEAEANARAQEQEAPSKNAGARRKHRARGSAAASPNLSMPLLMTLPGPI